MGMWSRVKAGSQEPGKGLPLSSTENYCDFEGAPQGRRVLSGPFRRRLPANLPEMSAESRECFTEAQMIDELRQLFLQHGKLSGILIDEMEGMPSSSVYRNRFGSLRRAYSIVGYTPERDYSFIEINRTLREAHAQHLDEIVAELATNGAYVETNRSSGILNINHDFTAQLVIARCHTRPSGRSNWLIRLEQSNDWDLTIAARMTQDNSKILDYYLLPRGDELSAKLRLAPENPLVLDVYRFENLNYLYKVSRRTRIGDAV